MSDLAGSFENSNSKPLSADAHAAAELDRSSRAVRRTRRASSLGQILANSLIASQRGSTALLRLSRPSKRNALDNAMIAGIENFMSDPPEGTRAIIIYGEGKHFSAGVDLAALSESRAQGGSAAAHRAWTRMAVSCLKAGWPR